MIVLDTRLNYRNTPISFASEVKWSQGTDQPVFPQMCTGVECDS